MNPRVTSIVDLTMTPLTFLGGLTLATIRRIGIHRLPVSRRILEKIGVFPIRDHYGEPAFTRRDLHRADWVDRELPGVDLNVPGQLALLADLDFADELRRFPLDGSEGTFHYRNNFFGAADAEVLYSIIRKFKPARIVEIGSGNSTLAARLAIAENTRESASYRCRHVCIEPYENPWLDHLGLEVVRTPVQQLDRTLFEGLRSPDILFIDSSHVIRSGGDVLHEFLDLLPRLAPGVFVHVHDIFTPRDYPPYWAVDQVRFWNEQYLLEAFLSGNKSFEVLGALNFLAHHYPSELGRACPIFASEPGHEPGSFWMRSRA